ncbi:D-tagatose-1,6-bisphosphate aldolase subunit gatZ [Leclercia adecarboxylata]|uniref:D-tagatose-1,6-bisphosphate aldolase subunit gatZ n=1 Tax=Leclercia adecarboxylata TaxID=83655 RepID=A0A4U9IU56_9ENTR|nr:D-tagatose-1,6-bisphosphate aldolase subunit gatZ [Leclercia adecarboxylata]
MTLYMSPAWRMPARTLETHQAAFQALGLDEAMTPGHCYRSAARRFEFDHTQIIHYQSQAAEALSGWIRPDGRWFMKRTLQITSPDRRTGHW